MATDWTSWLEKGARRMIAAALEVEGEEYRQPHHDANTRLAPITALLWLMIPIDYIDLPLFMGVRYPP